MSPRSGKGRALLGMLGFSVLAGVLTTVMVTPAVAVTGMAATTSVDVFENLPNYIEINQQQERNRIFATNDAGEAVQIATIFRQNREEVAWDQISDFAKGAAVSGEDRRYFEHGGVEVSSLVRALIGNVAAGEVTSGASTLTMQLVKNIYIQQAVEANPATDAESQARQTAAVQAEQASTIDRKLRDMRLAISLEKEYTKEEILQAYLNIAGYGGTTYGIEAAAERYFNTSAANLTLAQAASLVAIVQEPGNRSLDTPDNYAANQERRDEILGRMLADSANGTSHFVITQEQYDEAIATPVDASTVFLTVPPNGCTAANPYAKSFCDYVVKKIENGDLPQLGASPEEANENFARGGYDIYTSLNLDLNVVAQDADKRYADPLEDRFDFGSAVTSLEVGTGWIKVMTQNRDFNASAENPPGTTALNYSAPYAYGGSQGQRAGSTFKAYTLYAWLAAGNGLNQSVNGTAVPRSTNQFTNSCQEMSYFRNVTLQNDARERGTFTILDATRQSVNNAYIEMAKQLDICDIKKAAEATGVRTSGDATNPDGRELNYSFLPEIYGSADDNIAPLTMAASYATFASGGTYCAPIAVTRIVNAAGEELGGETPQCEQRLDPAVTTAVNYALNNNYNSYAARRFTQGSTPMIAKTGSTDAYEQTWIVEASTKMATAVWLGNVQGSQSLKQLGLQNYRHNIAGAMNTAINSRYGGDAFPRPEAQFFNGARQATVPDIIGLSPDGARQAIEAAGLNYADGGEVDSGQPQGRVASSSPAPGSNAPFGGTVTIYRSNGQQTTIPDVVSGNPPETQAVAALNAAGFANVSSQCQAVGPAQQPGGQGNGNAPGQGGQPGTGQGQPAQPAQTANPLDGRVVAVNPGVGSTASRTTQVVLTVARTTC